MPRHDKLDIHFGGALHNRVKVGDLEPQQHSVSIWPVVTIADQSVMMFNVEAMQLKDEPPIRNQLFICGATMITLAAQQMLVPPAACFHIGHRDQGLGVHAISLSTPKRFRGTSATRRSDAEQALDATGFICYGKIENREPATPLTNNGPRSSMPPVRSSLAKVRAPPWTISL
jgi:hypothetical protein